MTVPECFRADSDVVTIPPGKHSSERMLLVPQQFLGCPLRHPVAWFLVWDHVGAPLCFQSYRRTLFPESLQASLGDVPAEIHLQRL